MAPPKLTRNAPVLNVVHPLVVSVHPVFWHKAHLARVHRVNGFLRNAFASGVLRADFVHSHKPLVCEHWLHHLAGACANGQHQFVGLDFNQQALFFQVFDHGLAGYKAVHALIGFWAVFIHSGRQCEDGDEGQVVAHGTCVVVGIVGARDLHATGAKFTVNKVVCNDGDLAIAQRQIHFFAHQMFVAFVFGVNGQRTIGQHGFRTGGGNGHAFLHHAINELRAIGKRVQDVVHLAIGFDVFNLQIGHRTLQHRIPAHQTLASVNEALLVQLHKGFGHHFGQLVVHGEVLARPIHAVAHAAHLLGDGVARLFFPFPYFGHKIFACFSGRGAHFMAADALALQLALHHNLRCNARVVGTGNPSGVVAHHAVVAGEAVHDGLVERMAHVQGARDIGRGQLDGKVGRVCLRRLGAAVPCYAIATLFPLRTPMGFKCSRLKRLGQALKAGLLDGGG